jgi:PAS domain S-box-containing protein
MPPPDLSGVKPRSTRATLSVFVLALGVLATSSLVTYLIGAAAVDSSHRMARERAVLQDLANFSSSLMDAETGQRGYLLTGQEAYLDPHRKALARIRMEQEALRRWASAGEVPSTAAEEVITASHEELAELERTIKLRREDGLDASLAAVRAGMGKAIMDKIRAAVSRMTATLQASIDREVDRSNVLIPVRTATFILTGVFSVATLGWAFRRLSGEIKKRESEAHAALRDKEWLQTTLASIGDGVILTDEKGQVTFLNAEAERLSSWKRAEAVGQPLSSVFRTVNELTRHPAENPVDKVLRLGKVVGIANHTVLISKDGAETPIEDSAAPIREPGGPIFGVVLVFRDAREQRLSEAIRARLAAIVENSGDAILSKSMDGTILTWNAAAERLFGYRAEEIVGQSVTILLPPELLHEETEILDRLRRGLPSERLETNRVTKDGRRIPVSLSISPIKDSEGRVIGASKILHDISAMLAAREALAREKQLLSTTLASIGDGVIVTDAQGRVSFLNAEAERLTGWKNADARDRQLPTVFKIINEGSREPVEDPVEKVLRLGTIVGLANHTVLVARDGSETPIDDSAAPIKEPGGPLLGVVLVFRDFTAQKNSQNEIQRLNSDLERRVAERTRELRESIQELETFSYTVAHDLRAPLRTMHRSAEVLILEQSSRLQEEGSNFLRRIADSAARMDHLIQDLLAYSRVTRSELRSVPVEPRMILADLMVQMTAEIKERQADVRIENNLGLFQADPVLLPQVFVNLLSNALKFVPRGQTPHVKIWSEPRDGMERIWIEDNGIGIDTRYRERLFRLFERLDSDYPGTGIGLAIVKRAVERMGGRVGFEPGAAQGSRFWIELRPAESRERQ